VTGSVNEVGFEDGDVVLAIFGAVHKLVLLRWKHPQQRAGTKGGAAIASHVGDCAAGHQIQLQFDVVMAPQGRGIPRGLGKKKETIIVGIEFEILKHGSKI
jgi:hypothetical protein